MRIPSTLTSLAEYGIIEEVLRPLMSGKEAQIFSVRSGGEFRVAKVYKEAQNRSFKNRADYVEGRKVRNTRDQRAMSSGSRHGRAQVEAAWRTTEVDMIYRLRDAGVRVPEPYHFIDGVLVMEMITDEHGEPAPRLGEVQLDREAAQAVFDRLLAEVVRMLAAGVVHGDLSDFNVLLGTDGPVIIDFPQAVDASSNHNARKLLLRDVDNLHRYMARFAPERTPLPYAQEMWALYERGQLTPDTQLTGRYQASEKKVSTEAVLGLIGDATRDERRRREQLGLSMRGADDAPAETPPRPPSRYAQKREALIAARLEAARAPAAPPAARAPTAQRAAQHDPRQHASSHGTPRPRGAEPAPGQRKHAPQGTAPDRGTRGAHAPLAAVHERRGGQGGGQRNEPRGGQRNEPHSGQRNEPRGELRGGAQRNEPRGELRGGAQRNEPRGELRGDAQHNEPRGELRGGAQRNEPRGELRNEPRGELRGGAQHNEPRGEFRGDAPRNEPRGALRNEPRGELRDGARHHEHRNEPRGEHRNEPRGEHRNEPRGEHRNEPRGELRNEPRGELRNEPRGEQHNEPRGERRAPEQPVHAAATQPGSGDAAKRRRRRRKRKTSVGS
jgi:RIO kinase 1